MPRAQGVDHRVVRGAVEDSPALDAGELGARVVDPVQVDELVVAVQQLVADHVQATRRRWRWRRWRRWRRRRRRRRRRGRWWRRRRRRRRRWRRRRRRRRRRGRRWRRRRGSPGEAVRTDVPAPVVGVGLPDERAQQTGLRRVVRELAAATGRLRVLGDINPDDELRGREPLVDRVGHVPLHGRQVVAEGHQVVLVDVGLAGGVPRAFPVGDHVRREAQTGGVGGGGDGLDAGGHRRHRRSHARPGAVLDVEVDAVEPVRGREADQVLDELRPVGVVAGVAPVVVTGAADRDDRADAGVCVCSRNPDRNVDIPEIAGVEAGPVLGRQVEQDQLVDVIPGQARGGHRSPAEVLRHDDTSRRWRWRGRRGRRRPSCRRDNDEGGPRERPRRPEPVRRRDGRADAVPDVA